MFRRYVRIWAGSVQEMPGNCQGMVQNGQKIGPRWPGNGPSGHEFVWNIQEMIKDGRVCSGYSPRWPGNGREVRGRFEMVRDILEWSDIPIRSNMLEVWKGIHFPYRHQTNFPAAERTHFPRRPCSAPVRRLIYVEWSFVYLRWLERMLVEEWDWTSGGWPICCRTRPWHAQNHFVENTRPSHLVGKLVGRGAFSNFNPASLPLVSAGQMDSKSSPV